MSNTEVKRIRIELLESQRRRALEVIEKGHLAEGEAKEELSEKLSGLFNRKYVVLVSNGFSAILASLMAHFGDKPQKVVTVSGGTCFAMVNAIKASGSEPVFADLDLKTASPSIKQLKLLKDTAQAAVIPNHFGLISECNRSGLGDMFLIEDAAQSFSSSRFQKSKADVTILSFYPTKIINGIDGGAVLTDEEELYKKIQSLVSYDDQFTYEDQGRLNLKLSNVNAAFALGTLDHLVELENSLKNTYRVLSAELQSRNIHVLEPIEGEIPTKLILKCYSEKVRDQNVAYFKKCEIGVSRELSWLLRKQDSKKKFPGTAELINTTCSLPLHPFLTESEIVTIVNAIRVHEH